MLHSPPTARPNPRRTHALHALLLTFYFALRRPHRRDRPAYCDEASYLRWAQLICADPLHNLFISMEDAKLPLHYWLLALCYHLTPDPILSGRLFSVLCGALTIVLLFPLSTELLHLHKKSHPTTRLAPNLLASVLALFAITSPLLATYQRLALAEPLLLLESIALAAYSLRFARQLTESPTTPLKSHLRSTLTLALLWTLPLLTKQDFSYLLWSFPPLALALHLLSRHPLAETRTTTYLTPPAPDPSPLRTGVLPLLTHRFLPLYTLATAIALLLFIPVLFTSNTYPLTVRLFYKQAFYFSTADMSRAHIFWNNLGTLLIPRSAGHAQWWPYNPAAPLAQGPLYLYLTPPLHDLILAGTVTLILKRSYAALLFFAAWCVLLLGALCLNSNVITTRYALLGIAPLLLLAAWITASVYARLPKILAPIFLLALLTWPLAATTWQTLNYSAPTALDMDRSCYQISCGGGYGVQQLAAYLTAQAAHHPITVITENAPAIHTDYPWLALRNNPNIQLLCAPESPHHTRPPPTPQSRTNPPRPLHPHLPPRHPPHLPDPPPRRRLRRPLPPPLPNLITLFPNPNPDPSHIPVFALALIRTTPPS